MRTYKIYLPLVAVILTGSASYAQTFVCQDNGSTGFNWVNGTWVQQTYSLETYVIRKAKSADILNSLCQIRSDDRNMNTVNPKESSFETSYGCYFRAPIGESSQFSDLCLELKQNDALIRIDCNNEGVSGNSYSLIPNGEMVAVNRFSAPQQSPDPMESRDSLVITVGKCTQTE